MNGAAHKLPEVVIPPGESRRPNIMIFLIDTLRADRMNGYGYEKFTTTPAIDAFAAEGVLFEQAYSPGPWTLPTMASVMTGLFPCAHQTLAPRESIPPELDLMAERLSELGYDTVGLFANGMVGPRYGFDRGYDLYAYSPRNDGAKISEALDDNLSEAPFFLYVHNLEPHNPYHFAPAHTPGFPDVGPRDRKRMEEAYKGYRRASRVDYRDERLLGTAHESAVAAQHMAVLDELREEFSDLYDATVLLSDGKFGSTVEMLKARGLWDDMLVIFLSDHGEEFGEHGAWLHDQSVYEEMVRVPLIIKFPRGEHAGRRVNAPVSLIDVLPTMAEYLGEPQLAAGGHGISLMPLAKGEANPREDEFFVPAMRHNRERYLEPIVKARGHVNVVVRFQNWKGIWNVEPNTFELYDLISDPGETINRAANYPELVENMSQAAREWYASCEASARGVQEDVDWGQFDAEMMRNLRTLGYADDSEEEDEAEAGEMKSADHFDDNEPDPGRDP